MTVERWGGGDEEYDEVEGDDWAGWIEDEIDFDLSHVS